MKVVQLLVTLITFILCAEAVPCTPNKQDKSKSNKKCANLVRNPSFGGTGSKPWGFYHVGASTLKGKAFAKSGGASIVFDITKIDQRPQLYQSLRGVVPGKNYVLTYHYKVLNGAPRAEDNCILKVQVGEEVNENNISGILIQKQYRALKMPFTAAFLEPTLQFSVRCETSTERGVQLAIDDVTVHEVTKDCPA
ncbi:hypothetical protein ACHAPT_010747 [Fusarium lateritium]